MFVFPWAGVTIVWLFSWPASQVATCPGSPTIPKPSWALGKIYKSSKSLPLTKLPVYLNPTWSNITSKVSFTLTAGTNCCACSGVKLLSK